MVAIMFDMILLTCGCFITEFALVYFYFRYRYSGVVSVVLIPSALIFESFTTHCAFKRPFLWMDPEMCLEIILPGKLFVAHRTMKRFLFLVRAGLCSKIIPIIHFKVILITHIRSVLITYSNPILRKHFPVRHVLSSAAWQNGTVTRYWCCLFTHAPPYCPSLLLP